MRNGLKIAGLIATIVITILCGVWYVQAQHPVELQPVVSTVSNARMPQQTPALEGANEAPRIGAALKLGVEDVLIIPCFPPVVTR